MTAPPALSELTTMRVGGTAAALVEPATEAELIETVLALDAEGEPRLLLGGGSNTIVSDDGFSGTVVRVATRGIHRMDAPDGEVRLRVQAGENWDALVAYTVENGWSGVEVLSGIPGSVGAAPVQNIGAYGQELSDVLVAVDFLDEATGEVRHLSAADLELGYRTSVIKRGLAGVVTAVELRLRPAPLGSAPAEWRDGLDESRGADAAADAAATATATAPQNEPLSEPIAYAQLASALGVAVGDRVPLADARRAVLTLRGSKGMVLDPADPDSVSAGSFFTNPIVSEGFARALPPDAPRWSMTVDEPDLVVPLVAIAPDGLPDTGTGLSAQAGQPAIETGAALAALDDAARERAERQASTERLVKLSAAWLIEQSGIRRGFSLPGSRAAISTKHTLAIVNRGGATADDVATLARFVQGRVQAEFGVLLQPEPVLVGVSL